ncbi:hypothetical protein [Scale drop disease virus]|uniref:ORF_038R n=1 Tax=Scale drop disease virus TaxID=1697349 RepID=A0A0K1L6S3_9VIRU|nr:ORF_038R [Scale drop disease virus]AKU37453.1 ORF_038R [Scale drop disease virus]QLI60711.1 hypothetical protein [Scale drop disease virus]QXJ13629.1 ORF038R [Scale drop disease virus]UNH60744.1 hypothetical protein SDDV_ORF075 [Scale drop disease virus]
MNYTDIRRNIAKYFFIDGKGNKFFAGDGAERVLRSIINPPYNKEYTPTLAFYDSEEEIAIPFNFQLINKHFDSTVVKKITISREDLQCTVAENTDKTMDKTNAHDFYKTRTLLEFRVSDIDNKIIYLHLKYSNQFDTGLYKCTITLNDNTAYYVEIGIRIIDRDLKYMIQNE